MKTTSIRRNTAFTLIELLVVVAIIGIVATFAIPAARTMLQGSALVQASGTLVDQTSLARQHAISKNRSVEVRFYRFANPEQPGESVADPTTWQFRGLQYFELSESGIILPVGRIQLLPDTIIMNPGQKLSSLLSKDAGMRYVAAADLKRNYDPELPRSVGFNYDYTAFRFLPDGTTDLLPLGKPGTSSAPATTAATSGLWFITIHALNDLSKTGTAPDYDKAPPDFLTWMVDPVSGTSKTFRRGLK